MFNAMKRIPFSQQQVHAAAEVAQELAERDFQFEIQPQFARSCWLSTGTVEEMDEILSALDSGIECGALSA